MRSISESVVVALLMIALVPISSVASQPLTSSIAGVSIGMSRVAVKSMHGIPTEVLDTGDALDPEWHFGSKLTVLFWDRGERVAEVRATDPSSCTDTGVCPGMGLRETQDLLGNPDGGGELTEGANQFGTPMDTCWLEVLVRDSSVEAIAIKCQP